MYCQQSSIPILLLDFEPPTSTVILINIKVLDPSLFYTHMLRPHPGPRPHVHLFLFQILYMVMFSYYSQVGILIYMTISLPLEYISHFMISTLSTLKLCSLYLTPSSAISPGIAIKSLKVYLASRVIFNYLKSIIILLKSLFFITYLISKFNANLNLKQVIFFTTYLGFS